MKHLTFLRLQELWKNSNQDLPFCTQYIESDIWAVLQTSNSEEHTFLKPYVRQWLNFRTTLLASEQDVDNCFLNNLNKWLETCKKF